MPVWQEATKKLVAEGKLVVVGVDEEQHPDRCRLYLQWQGINWPMMHDPIDQLGLTGVPVVTAIDEYGVVRLTHPDPKTFEREFVERQFPPPGAVGPGASVDASRLKPDLKALRARAHAVGGVEAWRQYGDASLLWGGPAGVAAALDAYQRAIQDLSPSPSPARGGVPVWRGAKSGALEELAICHFRLGVAYRMRYDSPRREPGDFQAALDEWSAALALDPNQYIWRRRIEQYGPRLEKPYPFYDWVREAREAIQAWGETPVALAAEPTGAEIAAPLRTLEPAPPAAEPDPQGRILRDPGELIRIETAVAPHRVKAGAPVRVHLVFRPVASRQAHWNNESTPLRIWLRLPAGWVAEQQMLEVPQPPVAASEEVREASTELRVPADITPAPVDLTGYALYNVCEGATGTCLFRRQDLRVRLEVVAR